MIPSESAFDESQLKRRTRVHAAELNVDAYFASQEDVILKKLEFYREGGSEKHLRDIAGILKVRGEMVDRAYIESWAEQLGVAEGWKLVKDRV